MSRYNEVSYLLFMVIIRPVALVALTFLTAVSMGLLAGQPAGNIIAVLFVLAVLAYSSYRDIRHRVVSNRVWLILLLLAFPFIVNSLINGGLHYFLMFLWSLGFTTVMAFLFYRLHLFGGADAKALLCIAAIFPVHPQFAIASTHFPVYTGAPGAFPLSMLTIFYGALLAISVPIVFFFSNIFRTGIRTSFRNLGKIFLGYSLPLDGLEVRSHTRLLHVYEEQEGNIVRKFSFNGLPLDQSTVDMLNGYKTAGRITEDVWVTYDLPFIVFITAGFLLASLLGMLFSS